MRSLIGPNTPVIVKKHDTQKAKTKAGLTLKSLLKKEGAQDLLTAQAEVQWQSTLHSNSFVLYPERTLVSQRWKVDPDQNLEDADRFPLYEDGRLGDLIKNCLEDEPSGNHRNLLSCKIMVRSKLADALTLDAAQE